MRRRLIILSALALSIAAIPFAGKAAPRTMYAVVTDTDVRITMSDGVRLTADVVRPDAPGRFPVLLVQTPYNKNGINFKDEYFVQRGYVQVIVEVRGTGSSEGCWDSFGTREQEDSRELVDWASSPARPWSNGDIGLHGTSYGAINQFFTAAWGQPQVKAMFPIVPMSDSFRDIAVTAGQLDTEFIPSWLGLVTGLGVLPPTYAAQDPAGEVLTPASHAGCAANFQVHTVADAAQGGDNAFDGPFYRTRSPIEIVDKVRVPTFIVGGTFDLFQRGEPLLYQRLVANGVPARLAIGPYYHITIGIDAAETQKVRELELAWMDHYLAGITPDTDAVGANPVSYYSLGEGSWHDAPTWPVPGVDYTRFYLREGATLSTTAPAAASGSDSLTWHPAAGVCSRSTVQWSAGGGTGTPCETHNELNDQLGLIYDTPPLAATTSINGPITARLNVRSSKPDFFFTVRVEDVAPDGTATQVSAGWQSLGLRAIDVSKTWSAAGEIVRPYHPYTRASWAAAEPEATYDLAVEVFPVAATFAKDHRIRVSIQPSDAPHLSPSIPSLLDLAGAQATILRGITDASYVLLPITATP